MTDSTIRRFDGFALYSSLDAKRSELGLSWKLVADELWDVWSDLNNRRRDHPISPSTLTKMADQPRASCQHALFMLRWLGRLPESFPRGLVDGDDSRFALPLAGPDRRLRWDLRLLYGSMDAKRHGEQLVWRELAAVLRCSSSQLTGLRTTRFATGMDLAMRITQWVGQPAADFINPARW